MLPATDVRLLVLTGAGGAERRGSPSSWHGEAALFANGAAFASSHRYAIPGWSWRRCACARHPRGGRPGAAGDAHQRASPARAAARRRQRGAPSRRCAYLRGAARKRPPPDHSRHEPSSAPPLRRTRLPGRAACRRAGRRTLRRAGAGGRSPLQSKARRSGSHPAHLHAPGWSPAGNRAGREPDPHANRRRAPRSARATPALLTGGPRDLPARQQTLRATLEWTSSSWTERSSATCTAWRLRGRLHARRSRGCRRNDGRRLASLVDHNLLREAKPRRDPVTRCSRPCASSRSSGWRKLGAGKAVCRTSVAWRLLRRSRRAARARPQDHEGGTALDQIETGARQLPCSARLGRRRPDGELALSSAASLRAFWQLSDKFAEGRLWLAGALKRPHPASHERVAAELGRVHAFLGHSEAAGGHRGSRPLRLQKRLTWAASDALNTTSIPVFHKPAG